MNTAAIILDREPMDRQLKELCGLLSAKFPESLPTDILGKLESLFVDIRFGKCITTIGADGTTEIIISFYLGRNFEDLMAALRAGEL